MGMEIRFWTDPETDLPHILNHGVSEGEVEEILRGSGEEFPGRNRSRIRVGQTAAGRYLQVVYVPHDDGRGLFVVTAYDLSPKARKAFRKRQRRKRK